MGARLKIVLTGNRNKDLCEPLVRLLEARGHQCLTLSRETGYDFSRNPTDVIKRVVDACRDADVFINLYANYFFNSVVLAQKVFHMWAEQKSPHKKIINVGSTTDRVRKGKTNLYHYEKLALRELSSGLSLVGVWEGGPKVSHVSFGTLSNRADAHPNRKTLSLEQAAKYLIWVLDQPSDVHINEISIDPVQGEAL